MADEYGTDKDDLWFGGDTSTRYFGGAGNDTMYGGNGTEVLHPGQPNVNGDWIYGGDGDDLYYGGGGNDQLIEYGDDPGNDTMHGGDGDDVLDGGAGDDELHGDAGDDSLYGGDGNDLLDGGDGNDSLDGDDGNDSLYGGDGNDLLDGGDGNDLLYGGGGNDFLYGGYGDDTLYGGDGDDTLYGVAGNNTLTGNSGNDRFIWSGKSHDTITDFGVDDGQYDDEDFANNDHVNLERFFNKDKLELVKDAGGNYKTPIQLLHADAADGVIDGFIDGADYRTQLGITGSLTIEGSAPLNYDTTGVPCFAKGTLIETTRGSVAIEDLVKGDMVMTRDNGVQPIRWIGSRKLSAADLEKNDNLRPIRIRRNTLGAGTPTRTLVVSPQHRILVRSNIAQKMFGTDEVLVAAKQLLEVDGIDIATDVPEVEYFHMLFDRHEVVISNGAETESLFTGPEALKSLGAAALEEIFAIFPELKNHDHEPVPARHLVPGRLGRNLAARHAQNSKALVC